MKRFRLDPDTGFRHVPVVPAAGWDEQDEHVMLRWPYVGLLERYEREPVLICSAAVQTGLWTRGHGWFAAGVSVRGSRRSHERRP